MNLFKKQKEQFISQVVILSMIFGFTAGIVGQIVADVYIDPWKESYVNESLANTNNNLLVNIPELKKVQKFLGIQQDFEVDKSVTKVSPSVVGIYLKKTTAPNQSNPAYLPKDLQANGFVLTSDGWLVSYGKALSSVKKEQLVAVYDQKVFTIQNRVIDPVTGVVFLKITANNLAVATLGDSTELISGQLALTVNDFDEVTVLNIKNNKYQPNLAGTNLVSADTDSRSILTDSALADGYLGSPLVNLGGEVVGLVREVDSKSNLTTVIPINQFRFVILGVLRSGVVSRPTLGVSYLDLSTAIGLDQSLTKGLSRGALIYQKPKEKTPAGLAGLQVNDIIVSLDSQTVAKNSSLTDLLQQYQAGDKVTLEIIQSDGKTVKKVVTLGTLAE
ncbi:MAG: S1C family serine protease [Candidatus Buchananbacteria bacterium]